MNDAFWLYAMECEGKISTRKGRLNRAIKMLANSVNPNNIETQNQVFEQVGLSRHNFFHGDFHLRDTPSSIYLASS